MSWYYVKNNQRFGPISEKELKKFKKNGTVRNDSLVWKKGLDNWIKLSDVGAFQKAKGNISDIPPLQQEGFDWESIDGDHRIFSIKTNNEYGPFSVNQLKKFFDEGRIDEKTLVFAVGMDNWNFLGETPLFQKITGASAPEIEESERRTGNRRPFVARILFHNNAMIFEGICNDVSLGGMQILIADFPGNIGDKISINVHPDNSTYNFAATGKIVRILEGNQGLSIRFLKLDQEAKKSINAYIG